MMGAFGYWGVAFFFALSGFLVGRILIRALNQHNDCKWVPNFLYRRWLKTFPLYYLVLFISGYINGFPENFVLYIFYLKGFTTWTGLEFYNASWSLFVEELFYVICALVAVIICLKKSKMYAKSLLNFCFFIIVVAIAYRFFYNVFVGVDYNNPSKLAIARLDSPMLGFLIAIIKEFYPLVFYVVEKNRNKILLASFVGISGLLAGSIYQEFANIVIYLMLFLFTSILGIMFSGALRRKALALCGVNFFGNGYRKVFSYLIAFGISVCLFLSFSQVYAKYFVGVWFYLVGAALSAIFLIYFITMPEFKIGKRASAVILFISQSSYAVYLIHEEVIHFLMSLIKNTPREHDVTYSFIILFLSIFIIYFLAYLLVILVERPILNWRDRNVKV